jgi:hypothetical protein
MTLKPLLRPVPVSWTLKVSRPPAWSLKESLPLEPSMASGPWLSSLTLS